MNNKIILSTGKRCPKCGCDSLEETYTKNTAGYDNNYSCILNCGMMFAFNKRKDGKYNLFYNKENEKYLATRFEFREIKNDL
jgi:predicted nucleic-acid-binding Zn-ribbon protein